MSDFGVLSHEYNTYSELAKAINHSLITLKKRNHKLPGHQSINDEDYAAAVKKLDSLVILIREYLSGKLSAEDEAKVPAVLLQGILQQKRPVLPRYIEQLKGLLETLQKTPAKLSEDHFKLLDELCSATDAQTSGIFRKLWRK